MGVLKVAAQKGLPQSIDQVRRFVLGELQACLTQLFNESDDWFFDQVNASKDARLHQQYFDMMRLTRLHRSDIEKIFLRSVSESFRALFSQKNFDPSEKTQAVSAASLSLVGHQEMEQSVALDSMANRSRATVDLQLKALEARLQSLLPGRDIDETNNPLDPRQICRAMGKAIDTADWEIKYQLMFFKLFQRYLLTPYQSVVIQSNQLLSDAGVFGGVSDAELMQRSCSTNMASAIPALGDSKEAAPVGEQESTPNNRGVVGERFVAGRQGGFSAPVLGALGALNLSQMPFDADGLVGNDSVASTDLSFLDLFGLCHQIQSNQCGAAPSSEYSSLAISQQLEALIKLRESDNGPEKISDVDANIINLVAMLFDCVMGKKELPDRVKALISRLQIPCVKLAIADADFLNSNKHVARQLINELVGAGASLNEESEGESDVVFDQMQNVVQSLLDDFTDDVVVFENLLDHFKAFLSRENKRAEMLEKRLAALEEGKLKNVVAKQQVSEVLEGVVGDQTIPESMAEILDQVWFPYLCWIHHKHGKDSMEWVKALCVVQQMMFCLDPVESVEEAEDREVVIEEVIEALNQGSSAISYAHKDFSVCLDVLATIFKANAKPSVETPATLVEKELAPSVDALDKPRKASDEISKLAERLRAPRIPVEAKAQKVVAFDISRKIEASSASLSKAPQVETLPEDDPGLEKAKALTVGAWLQYLEGDDSDNRIRCKLAAHIKSVSKLIFVNRSGAKLFEKSIMEVAHDINNGRLEFLDESHLFDSALENVISDLRHLREKAV